MDLDDIDRIAAGDHYLAVIATTRADGSVQASVVNACTLLHPVSNERVVAFVTYGKTKLSNLRARPRVTAVFRTGWEWAAVEGPCEIVGPDNPLSGYDPSHLPELIRAIFRAAGGAHDDWATFDRVMAEERRTAVFIYPERVYSNATATT
ncbi:MAG: pyridoxamine 5'-phosphate oxidase family protein [Acidimicrobiales bacterium]